MKRSKCRLITRSLVLAAVLWPAVLSAQGLTVTITSFTPSEVSYLGKTPFELHGAGFTPSTEVIVGKTRIQPTFVDATLLTGLVPAQPVSAKPLAVAVDDPVNGRASLADAVTFIGPYEVTKVYPTVVPAGQGGPVTVTGVAFTPQTRVEIIADGVGVELEDLEFVDARTVRGDAPGLPAGVYNVRAFEVAALEAPVSFTLEGGLTYEKTARVSIPGPQQIETSLAEGTARFSWYNPLPYDRIDILDAKGRVIRSLPGDATFIEIDASGLEQMEVSIQGSSEDGLSLSSLGIAKTFFCTPQPLAGDGIVGELDLAIRGEHAPADVERCAADGEVNANLVAAIQAPQSVSTLDLGGMGPVHSPGSIGNILQDWQRVLHGEGNSLVTGFLLENDATVLEIAGYYEKLATFPGMSLRGRIVQVASPDDPNLENGFTDEFTFADITVGSGKRWYAVNYFRADKDVGYLPDPDDPNDLPAEPCRDENDQILQIPRGEYLLEVYAVGGEYRQQFYSFADDAREYELLIPGVPCPPYPLIRIRDMTGRKTLPVIQTVDSNTIGMVNGKPMIELTAIGTWLDEDGNSHKIGPPGAEPDNPDFEYVWTFDARGGSPYTVSSGSSSKLVTEVEDWGCYYVDLKVKDKACPRSVERPYQIAATPPEYSCQPGNNYFSFLFPTPEPSGICAIAGLAPPPGGGEFENKRPVEFRVFVAAKYHCEGDLNGPSVFVGEGQDGPDVEFALARFGFPGGYQKIDGVELEIEDLCENVQLGAKFLHVRIDDLGSIPAVAGADGGTFRNVYFVGKSKHYYDQNGLRIDVPNDIWHRIGPAMRITNHPPALQQSFWHGSYDEQDDTYHFSVQSSSESRRHFGLGPSEPIDLPLDDLPAGTGIPSYDNDLTTGFTAYFKMHQEKFLPEDGTGGAFGDTLGNKVESSALKISASSNAASLMAGDGQGGGLEPPEYHWEDCRTLFHNSFSQTLFDSILYTGTIGPVPVTVWASIGLGIEMMLESRTFVDVRPFALLGDSEAAVDTKFFLLGGLDLRIPCEIRADVLMGVASIAARLIPQAEIDFNAYVGARNTTPGHGVYLGAFFSLLFEIEACIWALVDEICYSPGPVKLLDHETIVEFSDGSIPAPPACQNAALLQTGPATADGAGGGIDATFRVLATSRPGTAVSFDGDTVMYSYVFENPFPEPGVPRIKGLAFTNHDQIVQETQHIPDVLDPAITFTTPHRALVAWTKGGLPTGKFPPSGIQRSNAIAAVQDILIVPMSEIAPEKWQHGGEATFFRVSDAPGESNPAIQRTDGMAAIAADRSLPAVQAGGEAMVTWVRYEAPFLVADGTQTKIYDATQRWVGNELKPWFVHREEDTVRPNLEHTSIYARRVGFAGNVGPAVKISPDGVGINIEPAIATSPSGDTTWCVWVHDSSVDPQTGEQHVNLIDSNLGRNLMYAVYTKAAGAWSAPAVIFQVPDDYPGLLEPSIALRGDDDGIVAFTALRPDASAKDSGLSNSRHVFACRIEDGVFGDPVLIHGQCLTPETGHWPNAVAPPPDIPFDGGLTSDSPEYVISYLGVGPLGQRSGSGNVLVTALGSGEARWTPPVCLTDDDDIHSNLAAAVSPTGQLHTFHLNGGSSILPLGQGFGGATKSERRMEPVDVVLEPDPAIVACRLTDSFPAPGTPVKATVEIANRGLAGTARLASGGSALGVVAIFTGDDGRERVVARQTVETLKPGQSTTVVVKVEMPHDPVRLRVELEPNPVDRDRSNNTAQCFFGAPTPRDLTCDFGFVSRGIEDDEGPAERVVAELRWSNAAAYEEIWIYRDGAMLAALSGGASLYVDAYAEPGTHLYEIRGLIGVSKSRRAPCRVELPAAPLLPRVPVFRRGDVNADGKVNVADVIDLIEELLSSSALTGSARLAALCPEASDGNDDGLRDLSDVLYLARFVFSGGPQPPAPFPGCGSDPTDDDLTCESFEACP